MFNSFVIVFFLLRHFIFVIWDIPVIDLDFFLKILHEKTKSHYKPYTLWDNQALILFGITAESKFSLCAIAGVEIDEPNNSVVKKTTVSFLSAPFPILHTGFWKVNNLQGIMQNLFSLFGAFLFFWLGFLGFFGIFLFVWFWRFIIIQQFTSKIKKPLEKQNNL